MNKSTRTRTDTARPNHRWRSPRLFPGARRVRPDTVDLTCANAIVEFISDCRIDEQPALLVIDLSEVNTADTKLIAALVTLSRAARREAVPLRLISSENVDRLLRLCHLDGLIGSDAEYALDDLGD